MKIRFLKNTNIRLAPTAQNNQPIGVVYQGAVIEVRPVSGDQLNGNAVWYADQNGWYYWGGMAEALEDSAPPQPPLPPASTSQPAPTPRPPVTPVIESSVPPDFEAPLRDPLPPPDDAPWMRDAIPEGETRSAPSLQELESMATGSATRRSAVSPPPLVETPQADPPSPDRMQRPDLPQPRPTPTPPEPDVPPPDMSKLNWALQRHKVAETWWEHGFRGQGMRIAIIGTGTTPDHPDLERVRDTLSFLATDAAAYDAHGLGIQCAIIAAGAGRILYGVAPEADLLIAKVGDQPLLITPDGLIAGMNWALESGAEVILSLAEVPLLTPAQKRVLQDLVADALSRGIPVISPVGVTSSRQIVERFPAALDGVLSVGAHDQFDKRCAFSAMSESLDLLAPAAGLQYSMPGKPPLSVSRSTAIAAAYTAGLAALVLQWRRLSKLAPDVQGLYALLCNTAISKAILETNRDTEYGAGLLNPESVWRELSKA
ncbi:MAG: S8 family peptidase [Saprospiraceae bacterium]